MILCGCIGGALSESYWLVKKTKNFNLIFIYFYFYNQTIIFEKKSDDIIALCRTHELPHSSSSIVIKFLI